MTQKRISRKDLKQDRFAQLVGRVWLFFEHNTFVIGVSIALIVFLGLIVWGGRAYFRSRELRAFTALDTQLQAYDQSSIFASATGEESERPDLTKGFAEVIGEYGGTTAALLSHYYLANAALQQGNIDQAIEHIEIFLSNNTSPLLTPFAQIKLCKALALNGTYQEALEACEKAGAHEKTSLPADYLLYEKAALFERWGKRSAAISLYGQLQTEYRGSLYAQIARQRFEALIQLQALASPSPIGAEQPVAPFSSQ